MSTYMTEPGLFTDQINPFPFVGVTWPYLHGCGFEWASFQVYNPELYVGTKTYDLPAVRAHGITNVGVWGVIYTRADFYDGGKQIGAQAKVLGADHCIINAEMCMKDTRPGNLASIIIKGVRDGGWTGPVDLSTLGAPWSPEINDYAMDTKSFLDTGGGIHSQDYFNDYENYHPAAAKIYWTKMGVPADKLNHTLGLYGGKRGKIKGTDWVTILKASNIGRNISIYQVQDADKADCDALKIHIAMPPTPSSTETKKRMVILANEWLESQSPNRQVFSRIRIAKRILQSSDAQKDAIDNAIVDILNDAGVPQ